MLTLKQEYIGTVLEIMRDDRYEKFDTNIEPQERYQYFYEVGFDFAFDKI